MPSRGFWAWIPDIMSAKPASGFEEDRSSQTNLSHAHGRTDSYRPTYHDDLRRSGILPPARARGSGSRVFRSTRRTSPNKKKANNNSSPNRVSKPASASTKKISPAAASTSWPKKPISSRPQTKRPETKARYPAPRKQNGRFGKKSEEQQPALIIPSSPPPNAPKAPLADRLNNMDSLFSNMDVGNTILPAHRAPFKHHVSSSPCTHYLCPVGGSEPHSEGLYLHEGKLAERPHNYFGANNPPPWLWETYGRVERSEASEMDFINLQYFISCHTPHFELCKEEFWE